MVEEEEDASAQRCLSRTRRGATQSGKRGKKIHQEVAGRKDRGREEKVKGGKGEEDDGGAEKERRQRSVVPQAHMSAWTRVTTRCCQRGSV